MVRTIPTARSSNDASTQAGVPRGARPRPLAAALAIGAAVALALAGCAAEPPAPAGKAPATSGPVGGATDSPTPGASDDSGGGSGGATGTGSIAGAAAEWTLVSFTDAAGSVERPLPAPTLDLRTAGSATGSGGCNSYRATYSGNASSLTIAPVLATKRACTAGGALETRYFAALEKVSAAKTGTRLTLTGEGVTMTFTKDEKQTADDDTQPTDD